MGERAGSGETSLGDLCVRLLVWMGSAIGGEWFWSCTCRPVPPARHRGHASGKVSPMEQFLLGADQLRGRGGGKWTKYAADVIPAFVADMDFKVAPAVQAAIERFTDTQDYGYGQMTDPNAVPLFDAFADWMARRHNWRPDPFRSGPRRSRRSRSAGDHDPALQSAQPDRPGTRASRARRHREDRSRP